MATELRGKCVLITGGGTGLGREIALQLAAEGMRIVISYSKSKNDAEETVQELAQLGVEACCIQADMREPSEPARLVGEAAAYLGRLDLLIHNAGTTKFIPFTDLDSVTSEIWDDLNNINTRSAFLLAQAAAPIMRKNGGGQIINTSSIAGLSPAGSSLPYSVSKAALIHLTKCLAKSLAPDIQVNTVAPGLLMTRWVEGFSEERLNLMSEAALLKKPTDVADCATAFVMLAKNGSITGQVIVVDSGLSLA